MSIVTVKTAVERYDFEDYGTLEESGRYVKFEDYAALAAQRDALAAKSESHAVECAAAKIAISYWRAGRTDFTLRTPNVDAFLREVQAQGVDAAIEHLHKIFDGTDHIGEPVMALEWLAQAIRKGGAT